MSKTEEVTDYWAQESLFVREGTGKLYTFIVEVVDNIEPDHIPGE